MSRDATDRLRLNFTIFCDDVRLEMGNKLSLMGVFHQLIFQHFPVTLMKFAVVSQWRGAGEYLSEVRILTPDRRQAVVLSEPSPFEVAPGGVANNISFFFNVVFPAPGKFYVQTLINSSLADEQEISLIHVDASGVPLADTTSESVN
jgi:hypothetical protein